MAIRIAPYSENHIPAVVALNERLQRHGVTFQFPQSPHPEWLPPGDEREIFQEYYLAIDSDGEVRGGYILKNQPFQIEGDIRTIGNYQLPLSEGIIERAYGSVALLMLVDALKRQPLLYSLGMGGLDRPLPRILTAMGWTARLVPFYFRVEHPSRFFRRITYLRTSPMRRLALDFLALSGLGHLAVKLRQGSRPHGTHELASYSAEPVTAFESWTDDIWHNCRNNFDLIGARDSRSLRVIYPAEDDRFIRIKVDHNNQPIGWAVVMARSLIEHKQFGSMKLGSIVDCLALTGHEAPCAELATEIVRGNDVDLIVSNQSHLSWGRALSDIGFNQGPSNFGLALSPQLTELIGSPDHNNPSFHFNRGDGDGPINL